MTYSEWLKRDVGLEIYNYINKTRLSLTIAAAALGG